MVILTKSQKEMGNSRWRGAQTVKERTRAGLMCCCDLCRKMVPTSWCKVFHTVDHGCVYTRYLKTDTYLVTDHMFICVDCRFVPSNKWIGCNCRHSKQDRHKEIICAQKRQ